MPQLRIRVGETFVLPRDGVVTVLERYIGEVSGSAEEMMLLDLRIPGRGVVEGIPEAVALRTGRPLMSRSTARQVLAVIANRLEPLPDTPSKIRTRRAKKSLSTRDPITMAKYLREFIVRGEGRTRVPVRPSIDETVVRGNLARALCEELQEVLKAPEEQDYLEGQPCERALMGMVRRMNPAPGRTTVRQYQTIFDAYSGDRIAAEFRNLEKEVKRARTIEHPEKRKDITARHLALMHVLDHRIRSAS